MQLRLPRRPRASAAHEPTRDAGRPTLPADDPWAGEDEAWLDDDLAPERPGEFVRFFRGAALGAALGLVLWGLVALAVVFLLG